MEVKVRITKPEGYLIPVINLTENEKDIYHSSGLRIARFENGVLKELFNPSTIETLSSDDAEQVFNKTRQTTLDWLRQAIGETWSVMCSCYELCDPHPLILTDESALDRFVDQVLRELQEEWDD